MAENAREIGELFGRLEALEDYRDKQNGALLRLAGGLIVLLTLGHARCGDLSWE